MASKTSDAAPTLLLIPTPISDAAPLERVTPPWNIEAVAALRHFAVENVRTARRYLRRLIPDFDIDGSAFEVIDKNTRRADIPRIAAPMAEGCDMGLLSEAGCPAVADPGAMLVAEAQRRGWRVMPLVGPSSIMMSLMASGMNGQQFAFAGYLPIDGGARRAELQRMQRDAARGITQIFIETPYRNVKLLEELATALPGDMLLCAAADITGPAQSIVTRPARDWRGADLSRYHKVPAIFLIGSAN